MCNAQMWVPQVSPTAQRHTCLGNSRFQIRRRCKCERKWRSFQSVPQLSPHDRWDGLDSHWDPELDKQK